MVNETAKSFCGSPAYLSPEMVKQKGKKATEKLLLEIKFRCWKGF